MRKPEQLHTNMLPELSSLRAAERAVWQQSAENIDVILGAAVEMTFRELVLLTVLRQICIEIPEPPTKRTAHHFDKLSIPLKQLAHESPLGETNTAPMNGLLKNVRVVIEPSFHPAKQSTIEQEYPSFHLEIHCDQELSNLLMPEDQLRGITAEISGAIATMHPAKTIDTFSVDYDSTFGDGSTTTNKQQLLFIPAQLPAEMIADHIASWYPDAKVIFEEGAHLYDALQNEDDFIVITQLFIPEKKYTLQTIQMFLPAGPIALTETTNLPRVYYTCEDDTLKTIEHIPIKPLL